MPSLGAFPSAASAGTTGDGHWTGFAGVDRVGVGARCVLIDLEIDVIVDHGLPHGQLFRFSTHPPTGHCL